MFATTLDCNGRALVLDRARVVGIVNVTPDSFSDGGAHADTASAVAHGVRLAEEGADMLDVGGESTRPGAADISVEEELARVIPVIEGLVAATRLPISVDTSKPEVMRAAVAAGAGMINDVYALRREGALDAAAELRVPVCLMHMLGEPRMMQDNPRY
ncbi:MAG TPA: dihydropteroate synthase, partial [Pinirhizobacter sp.]|uniref:dihydropteroate synthase n=1 Tax=Pinirhizobacter sp. TaxID=2950432 RepID=UPI002C024100